jgi:hypothetical protein
VNATIRVQSKAEHVGQEAEVRTGEEGDHVGQRQIPRSVTSFRRCGISKAETKSIDGDVDQMDKETASSPWTQKAVTVKEVRVSEVFGREKRDPVSYCSGEEVDEDEDKKKAACSCRIDVGDIHGKSWTRQTSDDMG